MYGVGQNCEGFGRHLNGLFKQAITAGKRVRAETKIASGAVSVSSAAAELAALKLPTQQLQDAKVCIKGGLAGYTRTTMLCLFVLSCGGIARVLQIARSRFAMRVNINLAHGRVIVLFCSCLHCGDTYADFLERCCRCV